MSAFFIAGALLIAINIGLFPYTDGYVVLAFYTIFFLQSVWNRKLSINVLHRLSIWLLLIVGLAYGMMSYLSGSGLVDNMMRYFVIPALVFATGYTLTNCTKANCIRIAEKCLCAVAIGCSIHVILNIIANIGLKNRMDSVDFFAGRRAATNLGSLNTYIFALLPCIVITKRKKIKMVGIILFSLSIVYAFILGTRSTVYGLIIMIIISAVLYIKNHYPKGKRVSVIAKWCAVAIVFGGILTWMYLNDFMSMRTRIEMSMLASRYQNAKTASYDAKRFRLFKEGVAYLFLHPLGGNQMGREYYFHNYWLDVGRVAGTVPLILLILFDVMMFKHMFKLFKNKNIAEDFRYALLGIYVCMFVNFFVEPIMDGYLDLFYRFTFVNGMVEGIYHLSAEKTRTISIPLLKRS